jgi:transposase-like protein
MKQPSSRPGVPSATLSTTRRRRSKPRLTRKLKITRGLTTGDTRAHLGEIYGVEVSRDLISRVTDEVADELHRWTSRDS